MGVGPFGGTPLICVLIMGLIAGWVGTRRVRGRRVPHGVVKLVGVDRMVSLTFYIIVWVTIKLATLF